jgi:hypothetical protein
MEESLATSIYSSKSNIEKYLREVGWKVVNRIRLASDRVSTDAIL